ncbi:uncharacterized protein LOC119108529 [Pollicipes pollicipes]|uniref:uncharacterized protein LOC119108529 n=1 Tax=Pollicipes pollicipes TaxID=41117 RepID=UPI001884F9A7|nr:uncharacterized protein LOC119108529 [Pollicipes pollicipes]
MRIITAVALCVLGSASVWGQTEECPPEEVTTGCRISNGNCVCAQECNTMFPYQDESACQEAIQARSSDPCRPSPCERGFCVQTASHPGFKCYCFGTGYYGERCENNCGAIRRRRWNDLTFPLSCVGV